MTATDVTGHALERYQILHPGATAAQVAVALDYTTRVAPALVAVLTQCPRRAHGNDEYLFDGKGIFVIACGRARTYLRLGETQIRVLAPEGGCP